MIFIISMILGVYLLGMLIGWSCAVEHGIKIKFSAFKKFYAINPGRWSIYEDHVSCNTISFSREDFHFGFIDFIRYQWWFRGYKKRVRVEKENEIMKKLVDSVKRDIEKTEREARRYQDEAKEHMKFAGGGGSGYV